jgi:two-component system, LytTR family, response regulator
VLRVVVVDDEAHARAAIRLLLQRRREVEIVAECRDGVEAVAVLQWLTVDLLLLDVQMPGLDGFEVIRAVGPERLPPTIFVTAHDAFALRAFDVEAVDYVLKPFDEARFFVAFDRACRRIDQASMAERARRLLSARGSPINVPPAIRTERLPVPTGNKIIFLAIDEIDWIQAADQYVMIHAGSREYLLRESLQRLSTVLPPDRFAQIHRSHIVNLQNVRAIERRAKGDAEVTLGDGTRLRWSRRYRRRR